MSSVATEHLDLSLSKPVRRPGPDLNWWSQLKLVRADFFGFLSDCSKQYGDLFCIQPTPFSRIFVVNSLELAREILQERQAEFQKSRQTRFMVGKFLGMGLVLSESAEHQRQRNMLLPNFSSKSFGMFSDSVSTIVKRNLGDLDPKNPLDIEPWLTNIAMDSITTFLTGIPATTADVQNSDQSAFRDLAVAIGGRFSSMPLPSWVPTPRNFRERAATQKVERLVTSLLERSRQNGHQSDCMLSNLGRRLDNGEITTRFVRDQMVTMLFAGHETVAKAMTWALYLLAKNPAIQDEVALELKTVPCEQGLRVQDLPRLRCLGNVVKETLRLFPPVWVFDRSPIKELELGEQKIAPGDTIYISPYLLHRQERYFEEPLTFKPSRFEGRVENDAYIPYGLGARGCIGKSIAGIETSLVLAQILSSWRVGLVRSDGAKPQAGATLAPSGPILLNFEHREY